MHSVMYLYKIYPCPQAIQSQGKYIGLYREGGDRKLTRENIIGEGRKGRNVD